jgi:hypothetical protein
VRELIVIFEVLEVVIRELALGALDEHFFDLDSTVDNGGRCG